METRSMSRALALDLTKLMAGLLRVAPRGVDRVEFGYASGLLRSWPGPCVAIMPTPWGQRAIDRDHALRIVALANQVWSETSGADDRALPALEAWLGDKGPRPTVRHARKPRLPGLARMLTRLVTQVRIPLSGAPAKAVPRDALYLNVGQSGLAVSRLVNWLEQRPDIKPVIMLHDTLALDHPEFFSAFDAARFRVAVANTARFAAATIATTNHAAERVRDHLERLGRSGVPGIVVPLPVADSFLADSREPPRRTNVPPYFVCTGAIEPRKNHMLLLQVWRELVARHGADAPKLVIVGARWGAGDAVAELLDRDEALRNQVAEVAGLPTPALRRLLRDARAALAPSFAEGFGLTVIEALTVGTPVIASDIPAHREAGGSDAIYIDPRDGAAWQAEIEARVADPSRGALTKPYRPLTWEGHLKRVVAFLETI
jgi:glycosyltransferase involved in cell wall biosynthesis